MSCHGAGRWARTARYSGCSKKPWRGGFSRRRSGKPGTVSSQPQWTASVPMRWSAEVSRLMVPVAAPAARAARPKKAARWGYVAYCVQKLLSRKSGHGTRLLVEVDLLTKE